MMSRVLAAAIRASSAGLIRAGVGAQGWRIVVNKGKKGVGMASQMVRQELAGLRETLQQWGNVRKM